MGPIIISRSIPHQKTQAQDQPWNKSIQGIRSIYLSNRFLERFLIGMIGIFVSFNCLQRLSCQSIYIIFDNETGIGSKYQHQELQTSL